MFKAIGRYVRAMGYLVTGRIDAARRAITTNPHVVRATYDRVIEEKKRRIGDYKEAVARMIAQQEKKADTVRSLTEEVNKLEQLKEGAAAKGRLVVQELQGKGVSTEQIKLDPEYQRCMSAYNDFASTSEEKSARIAELEQDVEELGKTIDGHKVQLQQLLRDVEQLRQESTEAVADMITSKEEKEIADMISGVSMDRTNEELAQLRELRSQRKAEARVSRELAGTDTKQQEAEFIDYARRSTTATEFDKLIGLAGEADAGEPAESPREQADTPSTDRKLPEG